MNSNLPPKSFLTFVPLPTIQLKTKRWQVRNKEDVSLGAILWNPPWRKYCFYPYPEMLFDTNCLVEIANFLKEHHKDRNEIRTV